MAFSTPIPTRGAHSQQPPMRAICARKRINTLAKMCVEDKAGKSAISENAVRLARWLAADWGNKAQSLENPQFWSHIHVVFRPLPWDLIQGGSLSFYSESAYDYAIGRPYKSAVYRIVETEGEDLELECYKLRQEYASEYWMGGHEGSILEDLKESQLERMSQHCNTIYHFDGTKYIGACRPGNRCIVRRAGRGPPAYIDSSLMLTQDAYKAWDLGRDPETHERLWGTPAGPFQFIRVKDLAHLVPAPVHAV